jgi:hypothetical protein
MAIPEPVERYLAHAMPVAPPPGPGVRLRMAGRIKLGAWLAFTAEEACDGSSFAWRARVGPLRVTDRFADGAGETRGSLLGRRTLFAARGEDVTRSSAGRAALEAIWCPAALRPDCGVTWRAEADDHIVASWDVPPERPEVHLLIGPDGALRAAWAARWGNVGRPAFGYIPCGCEVGAERRFGALVVPSEVTVGWWFGTPDYAPFFRARVEDLRTVTPGSPAARVRAPTDDAPKNGLQSSAHALFHRP